MAVDDELGDLALVDGADALGDGELGVDLIGHGLEGHVLRGEDGTRYVAGCVGGLDLCERVGGEHRLDGGQRQAVGILPLPSLLVELDGESTGDLHLVGLVVDFSGVHEGGDDEGGVHLAAPLFG